MPSTQAAAAAVTSSCRTPCRREGLRPRSAGGASRGSTSAPAAQAGVRSCVLRPPPAPRQLLESICLLSHLGTTERDDGVLTGAGDVAAAAPDAHMAQQQMGGQRQQTAGAMHVLSWCGRSCMRRLTEVGDGVQRDIPLWLGMHRTADGQRMPCTSQHQGRSEERLAFLAKHVLIRLKCADPPPPSY